MSYTEYGSELIDDERPSLLARGGRIMRYLAFLCLLPISLFSFWPPYQEEHTQGGIVQGLIKQRDELHGQLIAQKQKLEFMRDPEYLEIIARDRLHLQKEGETIVHFENE